MRTRGLKRFVLAYLLALPAAALAITPVNGGLVGGTATTVNNGSGEQTDPHVDGDLAAYTDQGSIIRYFAFPGGPDLAVPTEAGTSDFLSDVGGGRIVFTRLSRAGRIMVFDRASSTTTELAPSAGANRTAAAIGDTTVAFVEFSLDSVILVAELGGGAATALSAPGAQNPAISPDGNVVVWEQCRSVIDCDVMRSTRSASMWSVPALVASGVSNPDTNGTTVVYDSDRPGSVSGRDIYFRPLAGGAETQLQIAGVQVNASISAGVIAFESRATFLDPGEIFIYVIATNTLFQVTNTPLVDDTLADVTVLPTGEVRVVWAANDGSAADYNIYARTFSVPLGTVVDTIPELIALVESFNLKQGISNSLDAKLENAQKALDRAKAGDTGSACHLLDAFVNEVNAQEGHELTEAQADKLRDAAGAIKTSFGCA